MGFDYDKIQQKEEESSWWTSYSDLWSMLSVVFLLMYVATSLRSSTQGIQQQIEQEMVEKKNAELQEQLRVYNALKEESLQQANDQEQEVYKKLMSKLSLLQEEAKEEKNELRKKAQENEEKEYALNQYQQIVRNIIDTNVLAKASIKRRDKTIVEKKQTIVEKQAQISKLNEEVKVREEKISKNEAKIDAINANLETQIAKLEDAKKRAKISTIAMAKTVERLKEDSAKKIQEIETQNAETRQQMAKELENTKEVYSSQLESLRAENKAKLEAEQKAFNQALSKQKISAAMKAQKLEEYKQLAEQKAAQLEANLSGLSEKVEQTEGQLNAARGEKARIEAEAKRIAEEAKGLAEQKNKLAGEVEQAKTALKGAQEAGAAANRSLATAEADKAALQAQKQVLSGELKDAQAKLAVKKNLIEQIKKDFAKNGIKATVDGKTGDVVLDFGEEYFDTGSAELKPGMIKTLQKLIPTYSASLFQNSESADKISNIEIIGFASSTFKGRYVNPSSLKPENQEAINYNLKLSFNRANSIFRHIFDPSKMKYESQKRLLPMVKVVGRGFLPEGAEAKDLPETLPESKFCETYNCKKAQRVIVRFNLKE